MLGESTLSTAMASRRVASHSPMLRLPNHKPRRPTGPQDRQSFGNGDRTFRIIALPSVSRGRTDFSGFRSRDHALSMDSKLRKKGKIFPVGIDSTAADIMHSGQCLDNPHSYGGIAFHPRRDACRLSLSFLRSVLGDVDRAGAATALERPAVVSSAGPSPGSMRSLEPGKLAGQIVLDVDIVTCPADQVKDTRVLATWLGGRPVYSSPGKLKP